jgi:hypothetical protein
VAGPEHELLQRLVPGRPAGRPDRRRSTPRCAARCTAPVCSLGSACWRLAAAGARWPNGAGEFQAQVTGVTLSTSSWPLASSAAARRVAAQGRPAPAGLPRHPDAPFDAIVLDRDGRGRGPAPTGPATLAPWRACSNRAGAPASRASSSTTRCSSATCRAPTSSSSTSSRAAACPARRAFARGAAGRLARGGGVGLWRRLRRDPAPLAPAVHPAAQQGAGRRVLMRAFSAPGSSTWRTAKPPATVIGDGATQPLALELIYARNIKGDLIVSSSLREMQRVGSFSPEQSARWTQAMTPLFPNIKPGDRITGIQRPGQSGALLLQRHAAWRRWPMPTSPGCSSASGCRRARPIRNCASSC